jgi:hypothetical protein
MPCEVQPSRPSVVRDNPTRSLLVSAPMVSRLISTSPLKHRTSVTSTAVLHCFGGVSARMT